LPGVNGKSSRDPNGDPDKGPVRETSIVKRLARVLPNNALDRELWVAEQTAKFHLTNIHRRLGVSNSTAATRDAYEHGLTDAPGRCNDHDDYH